jgi:ubiquitin carboxyl-terminal hydrolase 5/13
MLTVCISVEGIMNKGCACIMLLPANQQLGHPAVQNAGVETSMEWVFAHMEDADFNDPLPDPEAAAAATAAGSSSGGGGGGGNGGGSRADPEAIGQLSAMGFTDVQASAALQVTHSHLTCI